MDLLPGLDLSVGLVMLLCAAAGLAGVGLRVARGRARELSSTLAAEHARGEKMAALIASFRPALEALDLEGILEWAARTARDVLGVPYAHAATLEGPHHRTSARGESEAWPSWWHPTVQKLVLWCCRTGETQRSGEAVHGVEGFVAVPLSDAEGESIGALVVGGRALDPQEEGILKVLAGEAAAALKQAEDAPGGRDLASGLPNRASLRRVLGRELLQGGPLTVLAADIDGLRHYNDFYGLKGGDVLLGKLGAELSGRYRRPFRCGEDEFVVLLAGSNRSRAREAALCIRQTVEGLTAGTAVPLTASVGFVTADLLPREPDGLLAAAFDALGRAKAGSEHICGAAAAEPARDAGSLSGLPAMERLVSAALLEAVEVRAPYVGSHMRAVSRIALRLGSKLGLTRSQMEVLATAALLHDVGKIGIPDNVLLKPGRLTNEEYEVMKQHPLLGARILESVGGLSPVLPVVRHHHERFDGGGYPDGLRGEGIPLLARVVFVADAFDSMVRDRPYRRGASGEQALGEIVRNAGTQFDPEIVNALVELLEEGGSPRAGSA